MEPKLKGKLSIKKEDVGFVYVHDEEDFVFEGICKRKVEEIVDKVNNSIQLKNIDLTGISLPDELDKRDEEYKEFADAIYLYLIERNDTTKEHLLEESCDVMQVVLSILKILDIDANEVAEYWNSKHLEKIKSRPRKEDK